MVVATLSRGSTSVELPIVSDSSGDPVISCDKGKPEQDFKSNQSIHPRVEDWRSGLEQYTLLGRFYDSNAYSDAIDLAEIVKQPYNGSDPLILDIPLDEYPSNIEVGPSAGANEAVSIVYNPGRKDWVEFDLGLTRVEQTKGEGIGSVSTPTDPGSGPIILTDGSNSVELHYDIVVNRSVGRPNSEVTPRPSDFPTYIDKPKSAYDAFDISFEFVDNTIQNVQEVRSMIGERLGRDSLTLDFQGLYGFGSFNVAAQGSGSFRHVRRAGYEGSTQVPTLSLRRVRSD